MADSLMEKATSALDQAKETVTTSIEPAKPDSLVEKATSALGQAKETVTASVDQAKETVAASVDQAKETVAASVEPAKPASAETPKSDTMKDVVDNVVMRGIDGAKTLLHNLEEKKDEVSSSIMGAVSHYTGSADSTAANRDLPVSSDNQPLLAGEREAEPWWKNCCEVIDLLKTSSSSTK